MARYFRCTEKDESIGSFQLLTLKHGPLRSTLMASSNKRRTVPHVNTNDGKGNSYRPQNQHPDGLVRYHERLAEQHREQVRVTVQAMHRRKMKPHETTVAAVVKESGVASATIYRNDDLFALIQHANPNVQRRQAGQVYERTIHQLQEELAKAKADREYYQRANPCDKFASFQRAIKISDPP